jgi:hypothetical protein
MKRSPSPCSRSRTLWPGLLAGRAPDAGLLRHVGTCPRCRAALRLPAGQAAPGRPADRVAYVLAVVRAAGAARLAGLLEELARACAARAGGAGQVAARPAAAARLRSLLADVATVRRRLGAHDPLRDAPPWPAAPPEPASALHAARACLLAADHAEGPRASRQLELAACALAAHDRAGAGVLCSALVAAAGSGTARARLAGRAARVARAWGVAPDELAGLLRQPQGAGCN